MCAGDDKTDFVTVRAGDRAPCERGTHADGDRASVDNEGHHVWWTRTRCACHDRYAECREDRQRLHHEKSPPLSCPPPPRTPLSFLSPQYLSPLPLS